MNIINAHGFEHAIEPAALYIYNAERSVKVDNHKILPGEGLYRKASPRSPPLQPIA